MLLIPFCNKKCTVVQRQSTVELDCFLPFRCHIYNEMSLCYNTLTDCDTRHLDNDDTFCLTFVLICLILVNFESNRVRIHFGFIILFQHVVKELFRIFSDGLALRNC